MGKYRRYIITAAMLLLLAAFFRFALVGYSFLSYVLLGCAALDIIYLGLQALSNRRRRAALIMRRVVNLGVILLVLAFAVTEGFIVAEALGAKDPPETDYAIVLGAGVDGKRPSLSLAARLRSALRFSETNPGAVLILSGGQGEGEDITEAQCMYDWLLGNGVPADSLVLEERAVNTEENLKFSRDILLRLHREPGPVTVVTAGYHILRAKLMARDAGFSDVTAMAASTGRPILELNYYLREAVAIWYYIIFK